MSKRLKWLKLRPSHWSQMQQRKWITTVPIPIQMVCHCHRSKPIWPAYLKQLTRMERKRLNRAKYCINVQFAVGVFGRVMRSANTCAFTQMNAHMNANCAAKSKGNSVSNFFCSISAPKRGYILINRFKTKHLLRAHSNNQLEYECEICSRKFCTKSRLKAHLQSSCEPAKVERSRSAVQSLADSLKVGLNEPTTDADNPHMNHQQQSHEQEGTSMQRIKCDECGKRFYKKSGMIEHMAVHTKEPAFECWLCHKK